MLPLSPQYSQDNPPTILFLGAHSDDIEIGCGGSLLSLANQLPDAAIHWVVFSARGSRETEARQSATELLKPFQSNQISLYDFKDGYFPQVIGEIKDLFESLKPQVTPDIVFTHHRDDLHQDHRLISELTWNTFRNNLILEYEIPKYDGGLGNPNIFINLTEDIVEQKCRHLNDHFSSQKNKHWFSDDLFRGLMRLRGVESGHPDGFAEGFFCRKGLFAWC